MFTVCQTQTHTHTLARPMIWRLTLLSPQCLDKPPYGGGSVCLRRSLLLPRVHLSGFNQWANKRTHFYLLIYGKQTLPILIALVQTASSDSLWNIYTGHGEPLPKRELRFMNPQSSRLSGNHVLIWKRPRAGFVHELCTLQSPCAIELWDKSIFIMPSLDNVTTLKVSLNVKYILLLG